MSPEEAARAAKSGTSSARWSEYTADKMEALQEKAQALSTLGTL